MLGPASSSGYCDNLHQFAAIRAGERGDGGSKWPAQQLGLAVFRGFDHSACVAVFPARSYVEPSYWVQQFRAFFA